MHEVLRAEPAPHGRAGAPAGRELLPVPRRVRRAVRRRQAVRLRVAAVRGAGRAVQGQDQLQAARRRRLQAPSGSAGGLERLRRPVHHRDGQHRCDHRGKRVPGAGRGTPHAGPRRRRVDAPHRRRHAPHGRPSGADPGRRRGVLRFLHAARLGAEPHHRAAPRALHHLQPALGGGSSRAVLRRQAEELPPDIERDPTRTYTFRV